MAVAVKEPARRPESELTALQIAEWVEEEIAKGQDTRDACRAVLEKRIYPKRLDRALLQIVGVHALYNLWQTRIQQPRRTGWAEQEEEDGAAEGELDIAPSNGYVVEPAHEGNIPTAGVHKPFPSIGGYASHAPGEKRPKLMLEGRYPVRGQWLLLGDMTAEECRIVRDYYGRQVAFYGAKHVFFSKLTDALETTPTVKVRDRYREQDLRQLRDSCREGI